MRIIERFDKYMKYANLSDNRVTHELGLTNGVIGKSRMPGRDLSHRVVELIEKYYPDLNPDWLEKGSGEMLRGPVEQLADRLSEIIQYINDEGKNVADDLRVEHSELANFTNNFIFPSKPFDFVRLLNRYPEFNYKWIMTGIGDPFIGEQEEALKRVRERTFNKNLLGTPWEDQSIAEPTSQNNLWQQISFLDDQLKEKDAQIKQLLDILQKK